jgi:hypothetical protein
MKLVTELGPTVRRQVEYIFKIKVLLKLLETLFSEAYSRRSLTILTASVTYIVT